MFKKLFGKSKEEDKVFAVDSSLADNITSPMQGELLSITEIPDPVFSQKMMGDGFAINPTNGEVVSPVDGKIMNVFPSKHAIGIQAVNGREILIHVGIDTVNLDGQGFDLLVTENQVVEQGQPLLKVDIDYIEKNATSKITAVIFTNLEGENVTVLKNKVVSLNEASIIEIAK